MVLVEALISASLLVMLVLVVLGAFIQSLQFHAQSDDANALTQRATTAATRICNEMADGNRLAVHWDTAPPGVVFATPRGADGQYQFDSTGAMLWRRYVCYYIDRGRLVRKEEAIAVPTAVTPVIPAGYYVPHFASSAIGETWACPGVDTIQPIASSGLSSPALVGITLRLSSRPLGDMRVNQMELSTAILPRN